MVKKDREENIQEKEGEGENSYEEIFKSKIGRF